MKKSIIAAGAASIALAAMPIVGAFAAGGSVNDIINATLTPGCTVATSTGNNVNITLVPGSTVTTPAATSAAFTCNNSNWTVSAIGSGSGTNKNSLYSGANEIATNTSGTDSYWAFKVADLGDGITDAQAVIASSTETGSEYDYADWSQIPSTSKVIVEGKGAASITMKTQYEVFTAANQAGGTYTGQVTYTVAENL